MHPLKIGIVEDDLIIADAISEMLTESGYLVTEPATRYTEAISMIEEESPDLLLLDVHIMGRMDGIEVARTVNTSFGIPFIFLTANTDFETIERAKEVRPAAFLAKPITRAQLYAAIEIALVSFTTAATEKSKTGKGKERAPLFVRDGHSYRKVAEDEILYVESDQNYLILHLTDGRQLSMRKTLLEFETDMDSSRFLRIHRSFIVSRDYIEVVQSYELMMRGGARVPMSRAYRDDVLQLLGLRK
jgi:DNA-binding LytR/AlgR family response regulator